MGLFSRDTKPAVVYQPVPTEAERVAQLRDSAIEYIVSLPKSDKDRFIDAVDLIWDGYNRLNRVKTVDERQTEREAKAVGMSPDDADDLGFDFLDDPKPKTTPAKTTTNKEAK